MVEKEKDSSFGKEYWSNILMKTIIFAFALFIVLCGVLIVANFVAPNIPTEIAFGSLIIAFVGILATFVVVSNYAQVSRIENDIKDKIKKIESDIEQVRNIKRGVSREWKEIVRKEKEKIENNIFSTLPKKIRASNSPDIKDFSELLEALKTHDAISLENYNKYKDSIDSKDSKKMILSLADNAFIMFIFTGAYNGNPVNKTESKSKK